MITDIYKSTANKCVRVFVKSYLYINAYLKTILYSGKYRTRQKLTDSSFNYKTSQVNLKADRFCQVVETSAKL